MKTFRLALLLFPVIAFGQQSTTFQLRGLPTEVSGATVQPAVGPNGSVVINGGGSANFVAVSLPAPGTTPGVYFMNCCAGTNNAFMKFNSSLGSIFDGTQGQISFTLTSRYSFAQRQALTSFRYAFDVQDTPGAHQFGLLTTASGGRLLFTYWINPTTAGHYYVPIGQEDAVFGAGVSANVVLTWSGTSFTFKLNSVVVSSAYTPRTFAWGSGSAFLIGAQLYQGNGYNSSDDTISEFSVIGPSATVVTPTLPAFTSPATANMIGGSTGSFTVTATGTPAPVMSISGSLPAGVSFDPVSCNLSGVPSVVGTFPVTFTATNSAGVASQSFTLTVTPPTTASFSCTVVYDSKLATLSITYCAASGLIPASAFSSLSLVIQLPGTAAQWQIDARKYMAAMGSYP